MTTRANRRVAWITGASRGIGREIALELARRGYSLILSARTETANEGASLRGSLQETLHEVRQLGAPQAETLPIDMADPYATKLATTSALNRWARIDTFIHAAMDVPSAGLTIEDLTPIDIANAFNVAVVSNLEIIRGLLPSMVAAGGGCIVSLTSPVVRLEPLRSPSQGGWGLAYSASKSGLNQIAPAIQAEYWDKNIRAYTIEVAARTERKDAEVSPESWQWYQHEPQAVWAASAVAWLLEDNPDTVRLAGRLLNAGEIIWAWALRPSARIQEAE